MTVDQIQLSECYTKGWAANVDPICKECSVATKCKDGLLHGSFHEVVSMNPNITIEQLSQALTIPVESIQVLKQEYDEFMGGASSTPPVQMPTPPTPPTPPVQMPQMPTPPTPPVQMPQMPTPPVQMPTPPTPPVQMHQMPTPPVQMPTPQAPQQTSDPCKKRKGKRPKDLMNCPYCNNGFGLDGNPCAVCGGYGNISAKKLQAYQQSQSKTMATGAPQQVSTQPVTRDGVTAGMAGGNPSGTGVLGVLPLQRTSVPNAVQPSAANSGPANPTQTILQGGTSKRSKAVSGLERGAVFSVESILPLTTGEVLSSEFNNALGTVTVTMRLK
jgi:hypothetical protein